MYTLTKCGGELCSAFEMMASDLDCYISALRVQKRKRCMIRELQLEWARRYHHDCRYRKDYDRRLERYKSRGFYQKVATYVFLEHRDDYNDVLRKLRIVTSDVRYMLERIQRFKVFAGGYVVPAWAFCWCSSPHWNPNSTNP